MCRNEVQDMEYRKLKKGVREFRFFTEEKSGAKFFKKFLVDRMLKKRHFC